MLKKVNSQEDAFAVSVIIPAWNVEGYVGATLDSILSQTFRDFEVIFVDDGSTDRTPVIARERLGKADVSVSFIYQKNQGVSAARNRGFAKARGRYVLFFDADDLMELNCLEKLYDLAERNSLDIAYGGYDILHKKNGTIEKIKRKPEIRKKPESGKSVLLSNWKKEITFYLWYMIFRRSFLIGNCIYFEEKYRQMNDLDFCWRSFCLAQKVGGFDDVLVHYVNRPGSLTTSDFTPEKSSITFGFDERFDPLDFRPFLIENGNKELVRCFDGFVAPQAMIRRLNRMVRFGHEKEFWKSIKKKTVRQCLRKSWKSIFKKPEVFVKSMMALYFPRIFCRRYIRERQRKILKQ